MLLTVPNMLTWMRIFAIPVVVVLFYLTFHWSDPAAGAVFAIAGITDTLDGEAKDQFQAIWEHLRTVEGSKK